MCFVEASWNKPTPVPSPQVKSLGKVVLTAAFITEKSDTMRPSLLGSRFYCVTVAMETKWGQDKDKIAFGKFRTDWTGIVDIYLEWKKKNSRLMLLST